MGYFIDALKRFADFDGRARRKQYWMFILFYMIFYTGCMVIDVILGTQFVSAIFALVLFLPSISLAARRLHDTGRSGWWQLISLIPIIGVIVLIVFLVQDSHGDNDYGTNPKGSVAA